MKPAAIWLVCGCLCAVSAAFSQPIDQTRGQIGRRVQRYLDEASECRDARDFDCAYTALEEVARRMLNDNEQFRYWQSLGRTEFFNGNYTEAITAFRSVAELAPSSSARLDYIRYVAQLNASLGQFREAYETLEEMIAAEGSDRFPRMREFRSVAERQAASNQFQQAYDTLEAMLVRNGVIPLAWRHLTNDALWSGLEVYATGDRDLEPLIGDSQPFPREAALQGLSDGFADLEFSVTRTGATANIRVVALSAPVFESAAVRAAESLRYKPALIDGKPVEVSVRHRIEFRRD